MTVKNKRKEYALLPQIAVLTGDRVILNTGFRMIYPLQPVFARGLDVDLATIALVLTGIQLLGLSAPFIGLISERRGRRFTMLLGLSIYTVAMLMVFISPNLVGFAAALLFGSLGKVSFDPALQAYVGDRVPYERRGFYLGILEFGWAGGYLLGVPLMTWLIAQGNWQTPFAVLAVVTGIALVVTAFITTPDRPDVINKVSFMEAVRLSVNSQAALAGLVLAFGISGANQLVSVVFAVWIENSFGILLSALAASAVVIGASELLGEGIVTGISDRFGKRRLVMLGIAANIVATLILPFSDISLTVALIGLFFLYLTFETALVASLPLATELSPHARAMYMTVFVVAVTLGRSIFTPIAPLLFENGLLANCLLAAALNGLALFATWRFIKFD